MTAELTRRVPTGIPGLDTILEGGFLQGGVYIIEGSPGVGKTTLGSHFCFNHAASGGRAVYITLLAESHTRLLGHLRRMRFFDPHFVPDRVSYISAFKVLEAEGLASLLKLVRQTLTNEKASLVVLDGLVSAEEASPSAKDFKKFIHELQVVVAMLGCTALLLNSTERPRGFRPERTMVDGIIELEDEGVGLRAMRRIAIRKMRGVSQVRGRHHYEITDDGLRVLPRIETVGLYPALEAPPIPRSERMPLDLPELDAMLRGGLPSGSITAVVGPSGSGKTLLGMHFLHAGVQRGEPGVYFGFFERPGVVIEKSQRLGMALEQGREQGLLQVVWSRPVEGNIDALAARLITAVREQGARRLFLDGLAGFQGAAETPDRLREVMSCLVDELELLGVTSLYAAETPDLFGENLQLSMLGMSALTHNIILLRHQERTARTRRSLTVLKVRDSDHDLSVREFAITHRGILVAEAAESETPGPDRPDGAESSEGSRSRRKQRA